MKTRVLNLGLSLVFSVALSACNQEEYFPKDYLETPTDVATTEGSTSGGGQEGTDGGATGGTQGGVNSGVDGGSNDGSTTGSSTGGTTVGGTTTGGSTDGGTTVGGTTTGGTTTGGTTAGGTTTGGVTYEDVTEVFHQTAQDAKKLDIVWVIDNSGSMSDEQTSLGANFSAFIDDFISKNVNFQMAITTTDTSSATKKGQMVAGSDVKLNSSAAQLNPDQFKTDFKNLVRVGTSGSGNEKGLEGTEGFMQKYSTSFIRPDAYLAVVIISDEEDQSPKTVEAYTDYLKSFKASEGLAKVYSVVDVNNTNCCQSGISTGSERYKEASNRTSGIIADIRDDFYRVLSDMGESIINLLDSFALAGQPIAGSLKVYVNNVLNSDYVYDAGTHSIKFNTNAVPPVGAEIKVVYQK